VRVNNNVVDELPAFAGPDIDVITVNWKKFILHSAYIFFSIGPGASFARAMILQAEKKQ
jgi:hypothetical protein